MTSEDEQEEIVSHFVGKKVKLAYGVSDNPIVCTILGHIEEPDATFYHVELEDGSHTYIAVSGVEWITIVKDQKPRKKLVNLIK